MFFVAIAEKNQTFHFREKCAFASNALFSRKYRCFFGAKRRTNEQSERNSETEVERLQGGRAERSQGRRSNAENERSERRAEGGERKRDDRAKGERAERASICRQSGAASNSAVGKCSLFVVSSTNWAAACRPYRRDTEKRRNGTEAA